MSSWRTEDDLLKDLRVVCSNSVAAAAAIESQNLAKIHTPVRYQTSFGRGQKKEIPINEVTILIPCCWKRYDTVHTSVLAVK